MELKNISVLYEELERSFHSASSPEEKAKVMKRIIGFLRSWKKLESQIIEECLKMALSCQE
jgi:hypothetical protein